jgi:hypothetical protein
MLRNTYLASDLTFLAIRIIGLILDPRVCLDHAFFILIKRRKFIIPDCPQIFEGEEFLVSSRMARHASFRKTKVVHPRRF